MKRVIRNGLKVLVAGVLSILILSVFCVFYSNDGVRVPPSHGATDYVWQSSQLKSTMKEGFSWIFMDEYGYNNVFDYSDKPDILLMGSSHMEAAQLKKTENVGYLLNILLPEYHTYNIGISGHTIYRCVDNLGNAIERFQPQKYIVLVIDTIDFSTSDMNDVIENKATPIPTYNSGIIYYLQKIPAIKVLYKQLDDWLSLRNWTSSFVAKAESHCDETKELVLSEFLKNAVDTTEKSGIKLIIVYQPSQELNSDGTLRYGYSEDNLERFSSECEKQGIIFLNMTDDFTNLYEQEQILAHGFINSAVGEGHLNKHGHRVIAKVIVEKIQELEAE